MFIIINDITKFSLTNRTWINNKQLNDSIFENDKLLLQKYIYQIIYNKFRWSVGQNWFCWISFQRTVKTLQQIGCIKSESLLWTGHGKLYKHSQRKASFLNTRNSIKLTMFFNIKVDFSRKRKAYDQRCYRKPWRLK